MEAAVGENKAKPKLKGFAKGGPGLPKGYKPPIRLLVAMRLAMKDPEGEDGPGDVKAMRQMLRETPAEFVRQMSKLEAAHQAAKGKIATPLGGPASSKADEGEERCLELLRDWMKRHEVKP